MFVIVEKSSSSSGQSRQTSKTRLCLFLEMLLILNQPRDQKNHVGDPRCNETDNREIPPDRPTAAWSQMRACLITAVVAADTTGALCLLVTVCISPKETMD